MQQMENEKKSNEEALSSELLTWKEKYQMEVEKTKELEKKEKVSYKSCSMCAVCC